MIPEYLVISVDLGHKLGSVALDAAADGAQHLELLNASAILDARHHIFDPFKVNVTFVLRGGVRCVAQSAHAVPAEKGQSFYVVEHSARASARSDLAIK